MPSLCSMQVTGKVAWEGSNQACDSTAPYHCILIASPQITSLVEVLGVMSQVFQVRQRQWYKYQLLK